MPATMAKRDGKQISLWLPEDLVEAFREHAQDERRSFTAELSIAMENHLAAAGKWPRGAEEDAGGSPKRRR